MNPKDIKIGYAFTGSFCTIGKSMVCLEQMVKSGADVQPIMSEAVYSTSTRFGNCNDLIKQAEDITGKKVMSKIKETETIGPQNLFDIIVVAPCTGNTIGKLANGINDTCVTMAVKATIRNKKPVVIAVSTNDGLSASAKNIGILLNNKNYFFVPFEQDDAIKKPNSVIANFDMVLPTMLNALEGKQIQPIMLQR